MSPDLLMGLIITDPLSTLIHLSANLAQSPNSFLCATESDSRGRSIMSRPFDTATSDVTIRPKWRSTTYGGGGGDGGGDGRPWSPSARSPDNSPDGKSYMNLSGNRSGHRRPTSPCRSDFWNRENYLGDLLCDVQNAQCRRSRESTATSPTTLERNIPPLSFDPARSRGPGHRLLRRRRRPSLTVSFRSSPRGDDDGGGSFLRLRSNSRSYVNNY